MPTLVTDLELPTLELLSARDQADRIQRIDAVRSESWLAKSPLLGWTLTRHEDVTALLRDRRWHSAAGMIAQMSGVDPSSLGRDRRVSILSAEGEVHSRLRRLVAPAFSPKSADRLRPFMRSVIEGLVAQVAADGRCDLVDAVCEPYPIPIICELLGAPKEDWKSFSLWATDLLRIFNGNLVEDAPRIKAAREGIDAYVERLIADRRDKPADDLLTDLIAAEEEGDRLDTEELVTMVEAVIIGGTDTTRNQLANCIALFSQHPDQWRLLAERPELAATAVEECMRYQGAVRGTVRFATEDLEFRDVLFPKGSFVSTSLLGANFDPEAFEDPWRFDITRPGIGQHMGFGSGIHYCLGASLARAELQEALPILARTMPDLALDGEIEWKPNGTGIWGPEHLPIRWTPNLD